MKPRAYSSISYDDYSRLHVLESPIIKPIDPPDCPPPLSLTPASSENEPQPPSTDFVLVEN
jgi:hypothetical protein